MEKELVDREVLCELLSVDTSVNTTSPLLNSVWLFHTGHSLPCVPVYNLMRQYFNAFNTSMVEITGSEQHTAYKTVIQCIVRFKSF